MTGCPVPSSDPSQPPLPGAACAPGIRAFLDQLIELQLLTALQVEHFLGQGRGPFPGTDPPRAVGEALVQAGLLTRYQLERVLAGTTHGLVLGNYRVLDRLGAGAMCVVFLAEHLFLKRRVAIKVFPVADDCHPELLERFYAEMRVLADLRHPNIVMAFDAGRLPGPRPGSPDLLYLVLELVTGGDLEQYVIEHGPVSIETGCEWARQAACGLQEAHDQHLIHRDVKPSNLLLTESGQVKLVDFGLARQFSQTLTAPGALLGTVEYMPPEQSHDASVVGPQADIYGLGAALFWLLAGEPPYPHQRTLAAALRALQTTRPRRLRTLRPDAPEALDALLDRLLDPDPRCRPTHPVVVMDALLPFTVSSSDPPSALRIPSGSLREARETADGPPRVLIVDDEAAMRRLCRRTLEPQGYLCAEATEAGEALAVALHEPFDVVLLDLNLPDLDGYEVCRRLRERPPLPHVKVIVVSGRGDVNQLAEALARGADDYVAKPFRPSQLLAKVQHALELKAAQDRADWLARRLLQANRQLESSLAARTRDMQAAQDALVFALAKLTEACDDETAGHLHRLQRYVHCLALTAAREPGWEGCADRAFLEQVERCVPLHDIGKLGVPAQVLLKPGQLTAAERAQMQRHTLIGDSLLEALAREHGAVFPFLGTARIIVRHHHERHDGRGYPDGLAGSDIPPAARLVALADVYDALRRPRCHKPALSHDEAVKVLADATPGHFAPALFRAFLACAAEFEQIYQETRM